MSSTIAHNFLKIYKYTTRILEKFIFLAETAHITKSNLIFMNSSQNLYKKTQKPFKNT